MGAQTFSFRRGTPTRSNPHQGDKKMRSSQGVGEYAHTRGERRYNKNHGSKSAVPPGGGLGKGRELGHTSPSPPLPSFSAKLLVAAASSS